MKTSYYEMKVPGRNTVYQVPCNETSFLTRIPDDVTFSPIDRDTCARRVEAGKVFFMLEYHNPLFYSTSKHAC